MSLIKYNGVTLPYNYTTRFSQTAEYDESGTDRCYTKFEIMTQAIVTESFLSILAPDLMSRGLTTAEIARVVQDRLRVQRRTLSVTFDGKELIPQKAGVDGTVDAMSGPIPQNVEILQLNNTTFFISFHIIARYWENYDVGNADSFAPNQPGNNALYNRWEESIEIDSYNFTRRTRSGKFKIRSDNKDGKIAAEVMSQMCVVGVPNGFLRKSSKYTVAPDGLAIAYQVVDEEQFKMPPSPAYEASGYYIESSTRADAKRYGEVSISLRGSKTTPQERLVTAAFSVAANKLFYVGAPLGGGAAVPVERRGIVQHAAVRVDLYKNDVFCNVRVMFPTNKKRKAGIAMMRENLVFTPGSDKVNVPTPSYPLLGTAGRLIQAAAYYDPSLQRTRLNTFTGQLSTGSEVGTAGKFPE